MHFYTGWKLLFPFLGFLLVSLGLNAQQTDSLALRNLKDVDVVEKLRPVVTRQGVPVRLMQKAQIEQLGLHDISEALRLFSGVTIKDYGGIGGLKTVSVRGLGAQHTAVSYDGVTVSNTQSGQVDISRFSLDNVESLAVTIGQGDDIFQTARMFASAGALSIRTINPFSLDKPNILTGRVTAGAFGYVNPSLKYEQKINSRYAVSFHIDGMRADGQYPFTLTNGDIITDEKRKNTDIKTFRTELNLYTNWQKAGKLTLKGYWFDSDRGLPGSVILYNNYHEERLQNRNGFIQAFYENAISSQLSINGRLKFDYSRTRYRDFHSSYQDGHQTDVYTQREYYSSVAFKYQPVECLTFTLAEDYFMNTLDATTPKFLFPTRNTSLTALAGQFMNSRLTLTASLLNTYITESLEVGEPADDRKRLSPAVSLSYRILSNQNLRVRASFQDIFRTPTFNDLYYDRIGSKELDSEKARQLNAGLTWSGTVPLLNISYLSLTADGYYNRVKDKIVAIPTMFVWKMMNMGRVNIKGLNVNLSSRFELPASVFLQVDGSYSWQDATDATDPPTKSYGDQIPYIPVHSGTGSVTIENPWVNVSWLMTAVSERYALSQNIETNRIDGYMEQQLSFNKEFILRKCILRLHAEILNLGNITYDVIRYYPMPGRSFRAGIKITY